MLAFPPLFWQLLLPLFHCVPASTSLPPPHAQPPAQSLGEGEGGAGLELVFQVGANRLKVFALRGFGVTCHESRRWGRIGPWLSPGTTVSEGGRSARACLVARSRACRVRAEAELSEVLKPPGSLSRGRLSCGLPGPPAHCRQGPKSRGSGSCGSQRPEETSSSPSGVSFWAPHQATLGTRLSLTGIGELALQASAEWAAHPIPGMEKGSSSLSRPGVWDQGARGRE